MGYSYNSITYRVLDNRTRKVEETFNLTFDDYYVKRVEKKIQRNIFFLRKSEEYEQILMFDVDFDLIFGILDMEVDV